MPLWIPFYSRKRQRSQSPEHEERPRKRHARNTGNNTLTEITPQTTITSLPTEILTEIFELAVPPDHFLRARAMSTATGIYRPKPHSAWRESMAIKLAIPSVCRSWCSIGRRLLYRDITILDLTALHTLWAAFSSNRLLAGHVSSLKFMVYLNGKRPRRDKSSIRTIGQLIQCCPRLQRLDLFPYGGSYPPSPSSSDALAFPTLPRNVTSLSLGSHVRIWDFGTVILRHSAPHLKELRISFAALAGTEFVALPLSLPNLHTLEITCNGVSVAPTPTEQPRARWDMPQLRRVTFRQRDSLAGYPLDLYTEYAYVLALYGARLEYLHLPDCGFDVGAHHVEPEWEYGALLAMCPALEHVVFPAMALAEICGEKMSFPSVKWIDMWCHGACPIGERTVNRVDLMELEEDEPQPMLGPALRRFLGHGLSACSRALQSSVDVDPDAKLDGITDRDEGEVVDFDTVISSYPTSSQKCWFQWEKGFGHLNPYGSAVAVGVCIIPLLFIRIFAPERYMAGNVLCCVGYSWIDGHAVQFTSPGSVVSFILMMLPSKSGRKAVRQRNAVSIAVLGEVYPSPISIWISKQDTDSARLTQWTAHFRARLMALADEIGAIRVLTELAKWEGSIRGKWPAAEYARLLDVQVDMIGSLAQLAAALSHLENDWRVNFVHSSKVLNSNFISDAMAAFSLILQSLRTGERLNLHDRLFYHAHSRTLVAASEKKTHLEEIKSPSYIYYASAMIAVYQLLASLDELHAITKELCGEVPLEGFASWREEYDVNHSV
ncbi:hypothetical protein DFH08DRAFT_826257 [Mycena albidolilacea]|uniref:DUF2421 domain-containing protein n=1 Tax=Mycena albidolilacea TaxID=1033008 RepID=A0AAD6Z0C2_9AGAR|nr:hypothetical protein DFH08DRAFT_826257 [Mycena albidolilacea]